MMAAPMAAEISVADLGMYTCMNECALVHVIKMHTDCAVRKVLHSPKKHPKSSYNA